MKKLTLEMPMISSCDVEQCGYNQNKNCHAKAITLMLLKLEQLKKVQNV